MSISLRHAAASRKGTHHGRNEDAWAAYPLPASTVGGLFVVCDGVSTTRAGAEASALVAARMGQFCDQRGPRQLAQLVQFVTEIDWEMRGSPHKLASTLSAAWIEGNDAHVLTIGDSPVYRLRNKRLRQAGAERTGTFRRLQAYMGMGPKVTDQLVSEHWSLLAGDVLLLMSDGLSEVLDEDELRDLWLDNPEPAAFVEAAIEAVADAKGEDDATVIAIAASA